ncbi:unnamed protein product [Bursaphelenchus xylophilus]|uniref:(pine wood nematode) hypothetical protein n=1 Tax=Bursaphelenchus xylophilus TaxID=6326 RepID=A0A7I8WLT4_BURXY|nr:unnamed protein product [Bursaphelenchus xylophilus]CAG9105024.1 unnamed protein product [Bursaphelenchus xylophilus]
MLKCFLDIQPTSCSASLHCNNPRYFSYPKAYPDNEGYYNVSVRHPVDHQIWACRGLRKFGTTAEKMALGREKNPIILDDDDESELESPPSTKSPKVPPEECSAIHIRWRRMALIQMERLVKFPGEKWEL